MKTPMQQYLNGLIEDENAYQFFFTHKQSKELISWIYARLKRHAEYMLKKEKETLKDAYFHGYLSDKNAFDEYYKEKFNDYE